jgi:hypothetical protein
MNTYNLEPHQIADLRNGGTQVVDTPDGTVQLCGPGSFVIEFVDAKNVYLSVADIDHMEREDQR